MLYGILFEEILELAECEILQIFLNEITKPYHEIMYILKKNLFEIF
jgi:hypothetical protein